MDLRIHKLARTVIQHSCALKRNENVLIEAINAPIEIVIALIREAKARGATPLVALKHDRIIRELSRLYNENDVSLLAECELHTMKKMDAFITIRATENAQEYADIPVAKMKSVLERYIKPVHYQYRNEQIKWVALRWPTSSMAQRLGMSTEAFENFFFEVCDIDYTRMEKAMRPLAAAMKSTDQVRIIGPGDTDLRFSIKGMSHYKSTGRHNLPDGELFTAPLKNSVNGRICYNVPSVFYGRRFENISLDFKKGKIIDASSSETRRLNELLDQDSGARYIGEFAFGLHPRITRPMNDILFDEKMTGSVHLAIGNAYSTCDNGNRSAIHWDLILLQTPESGGGEVYFDDTLIRRNGRFVGNELAALNPENL